MLNQLHHRGEEKDKEEKGGWKKEEGKMRGKNQLFVGWIPKSNGLKKQ